MYGRNNNTTRNTGDDGVKYDRPLVDWSEDDDMVDPSDYAIADEVDFVEVSGLDEIIEEDDDELLAKWARLRNRT